VSKAAGNRLGFYRNVPVFGELLPHIVIRAIIERSREAAFDGISLGLLARKSQKGREYYELVSLVYNAGKRFGYVSQQAFHRIDGIEHLITPIRDFEIEVDDVDPFNCAVCGTAKKLFYRVGRRRYCEEHKQAA
jgi:hypothetical protein